MAQAVHQELDEDSIDPLRAMADAQEEAPNVGVARFALKYENSFLVANSLGDINGFSDGLFAEDTRLLSNFVLRIGGRRPVLLGAAMSQDNVFFDANLTNALVTLKDGTELDQGTVYINRTRFLYEGRMFERVAVTNFGMSRIVLPVSFSIAADFNDIFEVRGVSRVERGQKLETERGDNCIRYRYRGLDDVERSVWVGFSRSVVHDVEQGMVTLDLPIPRGVKRVIYLEAGATPDRPRRERHRKMQARAHRAMKLKRRRGATLKSSGPLFNDWLSRTRADIALLTSDLQTGPYPFAGIPWYSTAFGRDGIITALEMLWLDPGLARGVLRFLALHQAGTQDAFSDAEPGKILHETRGGEMSQLREVPFRQYYGGVDTTPLFVLLASEYARRTGDDALIDELWPALCQAVGWIEKSRSDDPRGLLAYQRATESGLRNQGWKDSSDAIFHADGTMAKGPISLVEVQGYVFAALRGMAEMAQRRGENGFSNDLLDSAERLRSFVEDRFWMEDKQFYALALDGEGRQCAVRTSNAGHLLYCGLPSHERGCAVAGVLGQSEFLSGWGLRTVAKGEVRFNPMSYHNGSVWPHDTAICTVGIARYTSSDRAAHELGRLFEAGMHFGQSIPELFCGFPRVPGEGPVAYPVACKPQAWSAGSVFLLLQACLGLEIRAHTREIVVRNPRLPQGIDHLTLKQLEVGNASATLHFTRHDEGMSCVIERGRGSDIDLLVRDHA